MKETKDLQETEIKSHHYEYNGTIFANRKEVCDKLNISKRVFSILRANNLIKKIEE